MKRGTARLPLDVGGKTYDIACLRTALAGLGGPGRFPASIAILLEGMLRRAGFAFPDEAVEALRSWPRPGPLPVSFRPGRVLLQDYTGIRCWWIWRRCRTKRWRGGCRGTPSGAPFRPT